MLHIFTIICLLFSSLFISPERAMSGISVGTERVEVGLPAGTVLFGITTYTDQSIYSVDTNYLLFELDGFVAVETGYAKKGYFYTRNFTGSSIKFVLADASGNILETATASAATGVKEFTLSGTTLIVKGTKYKVGAVANGYFYPPSGNGAYQDRGGNYTTPRDPLTSTDSQSLVDMPAWVTN